MNYFYAVSTLSGAILGAGLFALPAVIGKTGIIPFIFFLFFLTIIQYFLHLIYAEIVLSTRQSHRMPGYIGIYFGEKFKKITLITSIIGRHGALLAYIILGGDFLHALLSPILGGNLSTYTITLFLIESLIILFGIRTIALFELTMNFLLIIIIILLAYKSSFYFNAENIISANWKNFLLPYGPIFFAVSGQPAIVEVCRLLDKEKHKIKTAIAMGTFIPAILTLIFVLTVVGVTGQNTTGDAITGLIPFLDGKLITLTLALALFAIITSYIIIAQSLREIYWWDLKISNKLSWLIACIIPFLLYIIGTNDLQKIIGLTGSINGGILGVILIILALKVKKVYQKKSIIKININKYIGIFLSSLFIFGLIYELINFFN